jgi:hypothetical protein
VTGAMVDRPRTSRVRASYKCHTVQGALSATGVVVPPTENALLRPAAEVSSLTSSDREKEGAMWRAAIFAREATGRAGRTRPYRQVAGLAARSPVSSVRNTL